MTFMDSLGFQTKRIKAEDIGNYAFPGDTK